MNEVSVECVVPAQALLGECPLWSSRESVLYWIDIDGENIHRFDPWTGQDRSRDLPGRPGSIALSRQPGRLLMGLEHSIVWFDWSSGEITKWFDLEPARPGVRLNDGRCDPAGRFWTGRMYVPAGASRFEGMLHVVEADGAFATVRREIGVTNGLAFAPDGQTMYFADTLCDTVWAYDYDTTTGRATNERAFVDFAGLPGRPDGACVDESGCYWVACVYGWAVARITPGGDVDRIVELPFEKPTMPAFGGPDLDMLYVTSIGEGGSYPSTPGQYQPGGLFAFEPGVHGMPEPAFAGCSSVDIPKQVERSNDHEYRVAW